MAQGFLRAALGVIWFLLHVCVERATSCWFSLRPSGMLSFPTSPMDLGVPSRCACSGRNRYEAEVDLRAWRWPGPERRAPDRRGGGARAGGGRLRQQRLRGERRLRGDERWTERRPVGRDRRVFRAK